MPLILLPHRPRLTDVFWISGHREFYNWFYFPLHISHLNAQSQIWALSTASSCFATIQRFMRETLHRTQRGLAPRQTLTLLSSLFPKPTYHLPSHPGFSFCNQNMGGWRRRALRAFSVPRGWFQARAHRTAVEAPEVCLLGPAAPPTSPSSFICVVTVTDASPTSRGLEIFLHGYLWNIPGSNFYIYSMVHCEFIFAYRIR